MVQYKHAIRVCSVYCFLLQQWLHDRVSVLRYSTLPVLDVDTLKLSAGVTSQFCKGSALSDCCRGNILHYFGRYSLRISTMLLLTHKICVVFLSLSRWMSWCRTRLYPTHFLLMFYDYCTRMFESDLSSNRRISQKKSLSGVWEVHAHESDILIV